MDEVTNDLLLAGYVPLRPQGLALPCYASGQQSNAWYCAVCSVDGDHSGSVVAFEPYEGGDVVRLPSASQRAVSLGEPWHDVLLWNGAAYVGTPSIIVDQLGDKVAQLASDAPLTLLDLAMASDALDRPALAKAAHAHLSARWGEDDADRWQADGFVRQRLLIEVRRLLAHAAGEDISTIIRELEIIRAGALLQVAVPAKLHSLLRREGVAGAFDRKVAAFEGENGIALESLFDPSLVANEISEDTVTIDGDRSDDSEIARVADAGGRVLMATLGPRARQLMRYIGMPDWEVDWNDEHKYPRPSSAMLDVVEGHIALEQFEQYSVIIWVIDEEFVGYLDQNLPPQLIRRVETGELLCILAPTLPPQAPPALLADKSLPSDLPFTTILDTSIVRSPFWSGNPKRSIDRRVADLISATAQLVAKGTPLHDLLAHRPQHEPLVLSISTGRRSDRGDEALASEVSSAGLLDDYSHTLNEERLSWIEMPGGRERMRVLQGEAIVRRHDPVFQPFAEAVFFHRRHVAHFIPDQRLIGEVPASIADHLRFPHLTGAFRAENERNETMCVVCAEAPNLAALRAASMTGWSVVRYSDVEALAYLGSDRRRRRRQRLLPSDIAMPQLNRLGRNRGLAVRGVDPRDVIRIRREIYDGWRQRYSRSELARSVRWYRDVINRYEEPPESNQYAAIPVAAFLVAEGAGDPAARYLRDHKEVETPSIGVLAKRTADLRASWAEPANGTWRLMLEDGRLPVRFGPVDDREVAAQKLFTIDGDGSVPLLFGSRLFHVWARATLTRSPSWSSRFSITRTFETFPIPDDFLVVVDRESGRASLRADPNSKLLMQLRVGLSASSLQSHHGFSIWERPFDDNRDFDERATEREAALLDLIGLGPDALDLDILERLVELNHTAGASR